MSDVLDASATRTTHVPIPALDRSGAAVADAADQGRPTPAPVSRLFTAEGIALPSAGHPVIALIPEPPDVEVRYPAPAPHRPHGPVVEFEGGEHTAIGNDVSLYFAPGQQGVKAGTVPLKLPNGLSLTYGQILSLGGDFYGLPGSPISDGGTQAEREARFKAAYDTLAEDPASRDEARSILNVMQTEIGAVQMAIILGQQPSGVYAQLGDTLSAQWNEITGGGTTVPPWLPEGRYLRLAETNFDHFSQDAVLAYQAGHAVALARAARASREPNPELRARGLVEAYALNAFADHYLSDVFSAGHMRTPRRHLYDIALPGFRWMGSLLARYMHDEDSRFGLLASIPAVDAWRAYGDKRYFDTVNMDNRARVDAAVQLSVDEVFETFKGTAPPTPDRYEALKTLPDLAWMQGREDPFNFSPMFVWDGKTVLRRTSLNNLDDLSWTEVWTMADTLYDLRYKYRPTPPAGTPPVPASAPRIDPGGWQGKTPVAPHWVNGARVRYAVSFANGLLQSDPGPWSAYNEVTTRCFPTLVDVPTGPSGVTARYLYRQFDTLPMQYVGQIDDNTATTFIDHRR